MLPSTFVVIYRWVGLQNARMVDGSATMQVLSVLEDDGVSSSLSMWATRMDPTSRFRKVGGLIMERLPISEASRSGPA